MKKRENYIKRFWLQGLGKLAVFLFILQLIVPHHGLAFEGYFSTTEGADISIKEENGNVVVSNTGSGGFTIITGSAMDSFIRRQRKTKTKTCENLDVVSVRDNSNDLLGTATRISESFYLTARHVLAGKNPDHIKTKDEKHLPIRDAFKKYFQIINKQTGKPLDFLLISAASVFDDNSIINQFGSILNGSTISSGAKWTSCQFGVHEQNNIFSQYSEGEVKLTSDNQYHFFLGVSRLATDNGSNSSDLTTFGSSGASIWVENAGEPSLAGVVSCLQTFQDPVSRAKSYFPKILSLAKILNSEEFYFEETTLENLRIQPQERDPHCPFTDGKGAGGFFTGKDIADKLTILQKDSLIQPDNIQKNEAFKDLKNVFDSKNNPPDSPIFREVEQE